MTYEEAKVRLRKMHCWGIGNECAYHMDKRGKCCNCEIGIAIECIERRIPTEPIYEADGYSNGELVYDMWTCPNCNTLYEVGFDDYDFCPFCGQAIKADWSEEYEKEI